MNHDPEITHNAPGVAIVIPYYQRQPGVLRRAVQSILGQDYRAPFHLIIVDDASPHPATTELAETAMPAQIQLHIIPQANAGPGAARNRGMDEARLLGAEIVAFLDSDDSWTPDHLRRGVEAMNAGFDIYVANWRLFSSGADAHAARGLDGDALAAYPRMDDAARLAISFLDQQLHNPIMKISSLIFRPAAFNHERFNPQLRHASEDTIFAYQLALYHPKTLVSRRIEVLTGDGVNIYESAEWGSEARHRVFIDQLRAMRIASQLVRHDTVARGAVMTKRRQLCRAAADHSFYMLAKHGAPAWKTLSRLWAADPRAMLALPAATIGALRKGLPRTGANRTANHR